MLVKPCCQKVADLVWDGVALHDIVVTVYGCCHSLVICEGGGGGNDRSCEGTPTME